MSERKEEIRREDKKWGWKFVIIIICAGIVGGLIGGVMNWLKAWGYEGEELLRWVSLVVVPTAAFALMWVVLIGQMIALPMLRHSAVAIAKADDGEDETVEERLDKRLNSVIAINSLATVAVYTCFGIAATGMNGFVEELVDWRWFLVGFPLALLGLVLQMVLTMVFQRWVVNFYKERNPEKQGSIYQVNFNKVWLKSCDEAEKLQIYRAGYIGYRVGIYTCLTLFLFATLGALIGWLSWATILFVGIVWAAMTVGYIVASSQRGNSTAIAI